MRQRRTSYRIAASYDTETTNMVSDADHVAICILYIFADLLDVDLRTYEQGNEHINFYRSEKEAIGYIQRLVDRGLNEGFVPIICAYNLMFDLQTLMETLNYLYDIKVNAQSGTNVYTLDLLQDEKIVLRFWDTFHLEMRGLRAMGETCGLPKAVGDWDYTLIRSKDTALTDKELYYAGRDVQVIPAYLRYLLQANEWLTEDMLGNIVLTKTSIVRQMSKNVLGKLKMNGHSKSIFFEFKNLCFFENPKNYNRYALRKACFRGGLTFTAANNANKLWHDVCSLDVTSMHHTFINGRMIPVKFKFDNNNMLEKACNYVLNTSVESVLTLYEKPFPYALHARIEFTNLRLKKGTIFEKAGIAILPQAKFRKVVTRDEVNEFEEDKNIADESVRKRGFYEMCNNPVFAYGKLMSADICWLHLNEIELWCVGQVYDFDSMKVLFGEYTTKFVNPPAYISLQSNMLFETKSEVKRILKEFNEGEPYAGNLSNNIPEGIVNDLRNGTISRQFLESYYNSTVKGMFNGIYGTMAQDIYKPEYAVEDGMIMVDKDTITTEENYKDKIPRTIKVMYTYGMRIVAGSRMHLIISMMLLDKYFGNRVNITGGDTDSMKVACDKAVTDDELNEALRPIAEASKNAIDRAQKEIRENFPDLASDLKGIGSFDVERCGNGTRYRSHMEYWNKARASIDYDGKPHVTLAGVSRPEGKMNIVEFMQALLDAGYSDEEVLSNCIGYNIHIDNSISHTLSRTMPVPQSMVNGKIIDYLGNECEINQHEAICLYDSYRYIGDTEKFTNHCNVEYNDWIDTEFRELSYSDGKVSVWKGQNPQRKIMEAPTRMF